LRQALNLTRVEVSRHHSRGGRTGGRHPQHRHAVGRTTTSGTRSFGYAFQHTASLGLRSTACRRAPVFQVPHTPLGVPRTPRIGIPHVFRRATDSRSKSRTPFDVPRTPVRSPTSRSTWCSLLLRVSAHQGRASCTERRADTSHYSRAGEVSHCGRRQGTGRPAEAAPRHPLRCPTLFGRASRDKPLRAPGRTRGHESRAGGQRFTHPAARHCRSSGFPVPSPHRPAPGSGTVTVPFVNHSDPSRSCRCGPCTHGSTGVAQCRPLHADVTVGLRPPISTDGWRRSGVDSTVGVANGTGSASVKHAAATLPGQTVSLCIARTM
jgi:hypothetical protein